MHLNASECIRFGLSMLRSHKICPSMNGYPRRNRASRFLFLSLLLSAACAPGLLFFCTLEDRPDPPEPPVGKKLVFEGEKEGMEREDVYTFCQRTVQAEYRVSSYRPHIREGTWERKGPDIVIRWHRQRGGRGRGEPVGKCPENCRYASYEAFDERIEEWETIPFDRIQQEPFGDWSVSDHARECDSAL